MEPLFPGPLRPDATIGIIAPSGAPETATLEKGIVKIEAQGYTVRRAANLTEKTHFTAGTGRTRLEETVRLFLDHNIDAIICARGGDGGIHLLPDLIRKLNGVTPKPFVGYSDITLLQLGLFQAYGWVTFSGPMVATELGANTLSDHAEHRYWQMLTSSPEQWDLTPPDQSDLGSIRSGTARGTLLGGCLSIICALLGSTHFPDMRNAILIIEDTDEEPRHIDRMLHQLRLNGIYDQIGGMVLGQFTNCFPEDSTANFSLRELVLDATDGYNFPILMNYPYGHHTPELMTLPLGAPVRMNTDPPGLFLNF